MTESVGVAGGAIVCVTISWNLALEDRMDVIVEKESRLAAQQTRRNSGVVHISSKTRPADLIARACAVGR